MEVVGHKGNECGAFVAVQNNLLSYHKSENHREDVREYSCWQMYQKPTTANEVYLMRRLFNLNIRGGI